MVVMNEYFRIRIYSDFFTVWFRFYFSAVAVVAKKKKKFKHIFLYGIVDCSPRRQTNTVEY